MKARRGTDYWPGPLGEMIHQYHVDDIVVSTLNGSDDTFTGIVREVHPKLNKVLVAWGGGSVVQHDPDEIMLHPYAGNLIRQRLSELSHISRRSRSASKKVIAMVVDEFIERFLQVYSQFFLFHWQTSSHPQHLAFEDANEDLEDLMDKFVEAWQGKYGRVSISDTIPLFNYGEQPEFEFCKDYLDYLVNFKESLTGADADLANIVDEMVARMNKLLYLLTLA
jgi:hypothetical protein